MKKIFILFTLTSVLLVGCTQEKSYDVWLDLSQGQELIDSAEKRLTNAEVDFIIDDKGSILVNEKDFDKAIMCCS